VGLVLILKLQQLFSQINVCVDRLLSGTLWTQHVLNGASIEFRDADPVRPVFRADTNRNHRFFKWTPKGDMDHYYSKKNQLVEVKNLLQTNNMYRDRHIIDTSRSGTNYLARVSRSIQHKCAQFNGSSQGHLSTTATGEHLNSMLGLWVLSKHFIASH